MRFTYKKMMIVLGLAMVLVGATERQAEAWGSVPRGVELEAPHIAFSPFGIGGAAGFRVNIPLVTRGLLPRFPDALHFGVGADLYYIGYEDAYGLGLGVPLVVQWNLYFTRVFSLYLEAGINVWFHEGYFRGRPIFFSPSWLMGAIGFRFRLSSRVALQLRLGSPYSSFGVSFQI
ncbi:MAG: hypothetical protein EP343_33740 [Deltaproteobacteria bacterium]|nr:MAG: hypothetical protein EP343_33740 [Deltaproteobacteria bacterium]